MTGRYTRDTLQQIKERVSLLETVRPSVTGLKRKGRDWWACCPFHNEKTPSFHVREDEGYYHCFGCGAHGNVFDYVMETRGGTFPEAVEHLAGLAGIILQKQDVDPVQEKRRNDGLAALDRAAKFYQQHLKGNGEAMSYLRERGLKDDTIKQFHLGWAPESKLNDELLQQDFSPEILNEAGLVMPSEHKPGATYERFRNRLMFPIQDARGNVVGFGGRTINGDEPKYLNSSENTFFNKSRVLYNLNRAREHMRREKTALIVEGYMDVIGLWAAGVHTAVAPMGTAVTPDQVQLLWRYHDAPIVCLDGDDAGRTAAIRLARRILPILAPGKSLRFVWMPDGEDPDSFVQQYGRDAFMALLGQTTPLDEVLWRDIAAPHELTNGDGRAAVDGAIIEATGDIKNETVRRHYKSSLKDKLWQQVRGSKQPRGKLGKSSDRSLKLNAQEVAKAPVPTATPARILLAMMCRYPGLMEKFQENFAEISYENQADKQIQGIIFKFFIEKKLEKEMWGTYLQECDLESKVEALCADTLVDRIVTEETVEEFWLKLWQEVTTRQQQQQARKDALAALQANPSSTESWEKVRTLYASIREERERSGKE